MVDISSALISFNVKDFEVASSVLDLITVKVVDSKLLKLVNSEMIIDVIKFINYSTAFTIIRFEDFKVEQVEFD